MKTGHNQLLPPLFVFIICLCIYLSQQQIEPQLCKQCSGTSLNGSAVGKFCFSSNGRINGRCCLANETSYHERIIGLDLSNCSLTHVGNLQEASTTLMIDLSSNSIVNISDTAFKGFRQLSQLILPADVACPGGNSSWDKVAIENGTRLCEGQRNMCIQTGKMCKFTQCNFILSQSSTIQATDLDWQLLTVQSTPSVLRTGPVTSSAAAPTTTTDTSVCERGSSQACRCLDLWELPRLHFPSCCGSPRDERPSLYRILMF